MKVGFGHKSGHGKDTARKYLQTHLNVMAPNLIVKSRSFADKLKEVAYDLYAWAGVQRKVYYENNRDARNVIIPALGMTVVDLWIMLGNSIREINPETWIRYVDEEAKSCDILLCADVRFENETEIFDVLYKVENPRIPEREGKSSDKELDDFDAWSAVILNSGDHTRLNTLMEGYAISLIERMKREAPQRF